MIKAIVTDIEGTTSSLSFVKDVLFPYARKHLAGYVDAHREELDGVFSDINREAGKTLSIQDAVKQLIEWIDADKKITPLKTLQGMIWEAGYKNGDFYGHVYPDAVDYLRQWQQQGFKLYVYSSGSVHAQKLLFGHTEYGDLTPLFNGYFDTRIGAKIESASYEKIIEAIGFVADEVLFLSDIEQELNAAQAAGMKTVWLLRDTPPVAGAAHPQVKDFSEIRL